MILLLSLAIGCSDYALHHGHAPPPPFPTLDPWAPPGEDDPPSGVPLEPHGALHGGHFDAETTSFLSPMWHGSVDGHVHAYDERYGVGGVDYFDVKHDGLRNIDEAITDPEQRFKLLVVNPGLSPGGRLVVNRVYNPADHHTWHAVSDYADIPIGELPVFSLGGVEGTYPLVYLGMYLDAYAIEERTIVPTETECVIDNIPGVGGAWRNGALTVQAVAVGPDGDAFTVDPALSYGGRHGAATSGLLFEGTIFWHWRGPCSHESNWEDHEESTQGGPHG